MLFEFVQLDFGSNKRQDHFRIRKKHRLLFRAYERGAIGFSKDRQYSEDIWHCVGLHCGFIDYAIVENVVCHFCRTVHIYEGTYQI